jgi:hypothetical protein
MASADYWPTQPPQPRAEKEDRKMARVQQPGWSANTAVPAVWVHNPLAKVQQPGWNALGAPHGLNEALIVCQMCQMRGCVSVGSNRVRSSISGVAILCCTLASRAHLRIVAAVAGAATFGLRISQLGDLLQLRLPVVFLAPGGRI